MNEQKPVSERDYTIAMVVSVAVVIWFCVTFVR